MYDKKRLISKERNLTLLKDFLAGIQPMKISSPAITEAATAEELYNGKRPDQYDAPGGFINTSFGRVFIKFLKLSEA